MRLRFTVAQHSQKVSGGVPLFPQRDVTRANIPLIIFNELERLFYLVESHNSESEHCVHYIPEGYMRESLKPMCAARGRKYFSALTLPSLPMHDTMRCHSEPITDTGPGRDMFHQSDTNPQRLEREI